MLIHRFDAVEGTSVLDAFTGSGALGLEALSRGAASLVAMEPAKPALDTLKRNISACRENARTLVFACSALSPPPGQPRYAPCSPGIPRPALRPRPDRAGAGGAGQGRLDRTRRADRRGDGRARPGAGGQDVEDERRYGKARIVFLRNTQRRDREAI